MGSSTLTLDSSFYPGRKIGPFTLVKELGHGSFGVVWLANHKTDLVITQRAVKLPKTDDVDLDAFAKEAKVWVEASGHTNILELITAEIYSNQVLIASPYIPNGTLASWLEKKGKAPPIESAITIVKGILEGLKHLHSKKIIHRDLKPKNVLLLGSTPLIADFGLARVLRQDSSTLKPAGTPQYMSPEIWRKGDRCFEADLWAVGIILYEILVGKRPFEKSNGRPIEQAILNDPLPPLPRSIPDNLQYLITKSLEKEKINRFRSAEEMLRQLETHLIPEGYIFSSVEILSPNEKISSDHKSFRDLPGTV